MGCLRNNVAAGPSFGGTTSGTLGAEANLAPQMLALEQQYQPQLAMLASNSDLSSMNNMLMGNANSAGTITLNNLANTSARQAGLSDLQQMGPEFYSAMQAANPDAAGLMKSLTSQAQSGLDAGSGLTADQTRAMQQASRAAYASRGTNGSNSSLLDELIRQFNLGNGLQQQRQQFAQGVAQQDMSNNPLNAILGINSTAMPYSQNSANGAGFNLFNPQAGLGLAQSSYAVNTTAKAGQPSGFSSIMGGISGLLGGAGKMGTSSSGASGLGMLCWAAREVFGEEDTRWQQFRAWMLQTAPAKFTTWYVHHGKQWAERLRANPQIKATVRRWMETKIKRQGA